MGESEESSVIPLPGPDSDRQPPAHTPQPWQHTDRAQAVAEGATGPEPPAPPICPHCGLTADRHATYYGAHVLLEPGLSVPAHRVPTWHRWYVDSGNTAWNAGEDEPRPGAECRIPHRITCPGLTREEMALWRWLDALRADNARRAQRQADASPRRQWPDAG
ncbi:DUF6083 domain-containing protein [Streptomyces sp. NPDC006527]|jgi:hypothetical protein|uniref:DUF6083 domain-containing protein n=1 Tax=Streptomyces sp. NPDC006527 TaxID=3364749 RepID=UPI0036D0DAAB